MTEFYGNNDLWINYPLSNITYCYSSAPGVCHCNEVENTHSWKYSSNPEYKSHSKIHFDLVYENPKRLISYLFQVCNIRLNRSLFTDSHEKLLNSTFHRVLATWFSRVILKIHEITQDIHSNLSQSSPIFYYSCDNHHFTLFQSPFFKNQKFQKEKNSKAIEEIIHKASSYGGEMGVRLHVIAANKVQHLLWVPSFPAQLQWQPPIQAAQLYLLILTTQWIPMIPQAFFPRTVNVTFFTLYVSWRFTSIIIIFHCRSFWRLFIGIDLLEPTTNIISGSFCPK